MLSGFNKWVKRIDSSFDEPPLGQVHRVNMSFESRNHRERREGQKETFTVFDRDPHPEHMDVRETSIITQPTYICTGISNLWTDAGRSSRPCNYYLRINLTYSQNGFQRVAICGIHLPKIYTVFASKTAARQTRSMKVFTAKHMLCPQRIPCIGTVRS